MNRLRAFNQEHFEQGKHPELAIFEHSDAKMRNHILNIKENSFVGLLSKQSKAKKLNFKKVLSKQANSDQELVSLLQKVSQIDLEKIENLNK